MLVENIFSWFLSIGSWAFSLLPKNGSLFNSLPDLDLTFLRYITVLNGYAPIKELGYALVAMLAVAVSLNGIRLFMFTYNKLTQLIP
jgi:hypothetical protein